MNPLDFDDDQPLESALAEAVKAFPPPAGLQGTVRERLFGRPESPPACPRPRAGWRRVRRLLAGAIAGCLLVAAVVWLCWPETQLVSVAYAELAQVFENTNRAEWVHYFEKDGREIWMSFRPHRYYSKYPGGACAMDRSTNRQYRYDAAKGTLAVSFMDSPSGHSWDQYASLADYMRDFMRLKIEHFEQSGSQVQKGSETLDGRTVTVYAVSVFRDGEKEGTLKYCVDPETGLVVAIEGVGAGLLSWRRLRVVFEYPAQGPQSIYDLGVPRDVKIVDKTPPPEVLDLVAKVEQAAKAEPRQFYQVSAQVYESFSEGYPPWAGAIVKVRWYKEGQRRTEEYRVRCPRTLSRQQALEYLERLKKEIPVDRLEKIEAWLGSRKPDKIMIDDARGISTVYRLSKEGKLVTERYSCAWFAEYLGIGAWRLPVELDGDPVLLEEEGRWGKLVGIENHDSPLKSHRWYFNPDRDLLCERYERRIRAYDSNPARTDSGEVLEYAKTPAGRWFPKRIRRLKYGGRETILETNFRDDRRRIDPQVFEGARVTAEDLSPLAPP